MRLYVVLGPTGIGKTQRSIDLARRYQAPVVVLDRVQCAPELAVGSGRPTRAELQGIPRTYLQHRPIAQGILSAAQAVDRLQETLKELEDTGQQAVVLEGGSISMLQDLTRRLDWMADRPVSVEFGVEGSAEQYERHVGRRVEQMLGYGDSRRSLLEELAELWPHSVAREHLATVVGYREVIAVCSSLDMDPAQLGAASTRALCRYLFVDAVRQAHLAYSRQQRLRLSAAASNLFDLGCTVDIRAT